MEKIRKESIIWHPDDAKHLKGERVWCFNNPYGNNAVKGVYVKPAVDGRFLANMTSFPFIAPIEEPTYRPYTKFEHWMVGVNLGNNVRVFTIAGTPTIIPSEQVTIRRVNNDFCFDITLDNLFRYFTRTDGTPFGVKED